jgi:hypothetical protein
MQVDFLFTMAHNYYKELFELLAEHGIKTKANKQTLNFTKGKESISYWISSENNNFEKNDGFLILNKDQLIREPKKIVSLICSQLKLNRTIFARKCELKKTEKKVAERFLNTYHLMNSTQSAYNYGLYYQNELMAIASFSKGRKMNRLKEHQRSFELIRFCTKSGITLTGGLTRLIKHFCEEKKAGDVMTYIDKQISNGNSFLRAGFKFHSETSPNYFLINKSTFERKSWESEKEFDKSTHYLTQNLGNIKLVFTPNE